MSRTAPRPYLVTKNDEGIFQITVRTTRFNSQGFPLVTAQTLEQGFPSSARAKAYLRTEYRAEPTEIATK